MTAAEHLSEWDRTDDGWPTVACSCGWNTALDDDQTAYPGTEEAADAWGDHMWDVGYQAGLAAVTAIIGGQL